MATARPADAVVCATIPTSRIFSLRGEVRSQEIKHLYDGSVHRAAAHLRELESKGLVTSREHDGRRRWTLTVEGAGLCEYAYGVCRCGREIERGLHDTWTDLCRSCLADLADEQAARAESSAERCRESTREDEDHAQMLRAWAATLRHGGGFLLDEADA